MQSYQKLPRLFISHKWDLGMDFGCSFYLDFERLIFYKANFCYQDTSLSIWNPAKGSLTRAKLESRITKQIRKSDIVVLESDASYSSRPWLKREMKIARLQLRHAKPVLAVRPRGKLYWSWDAVQHADAWATWNSRSIVEGIRALLGLTPELRKELLSKGSTCRGCGDADPRLELNRLGGVYCARCGSITYRQPGRSQRWRDQDRVYDGFPLRSSST